MWDLILRHTGGDFFVDAPGYVFPVSYEGTGPGVFATALASLALGFGPLRAGSGSRVALNSLICGLSAARAHLSLLNERSLTREMGHA